MSRLRWPDSTNSVSEKPGTIHYMAVWKLPDKEFCEKIEAGATEIGFLDYFDQRNFSGVMIPPPVMNEDMIELKS